MDDLAGINIFEQATRLALRFNTLNRGLATVEDLWNLPLTTKASTGVSLDNIDKALNREIRATEEESFVEASTPGSKSLVLALEVVKHIIAVKLAENEAARNALDRRLRKEKILDILSRKQDEKLAAASVEELQAELAAL